MFFLFFQLVTGMHAAAGGTLDFGYAQIKFWKITLAA